jgi:predicted lipid-binding transport protein (Tim44 family)
MKKILILVALTASLGACTQREQNAGTGALIGAGTGAVVGGLATGRAGGALAGAAIGGAGGAIIGSAATPDRVCVGRDEFGRRVRYAC